MAAASPFDAALQDVLDRLEAAAAELDASAEPGALADAAAALAIRLTGSDQAELTIGGETHRSSAQPARGGRQHTLRAELRTGGQVAGTIQVQRSTPYTDIEGQALRIFASHAAIVIDAARRLVGTESLERAHEQTMDDLRRSLDRLEKVDGARQMVLKNLTTIVDKERKRFVSELHDDALQKLTAAELNLARLSTEGTIESEGFATVRELLEQTEAALRRLVFDVRPPALESPDGLAQSIRDRLDMLSGTGLEHELDLDLPPDLLPDDRALIFRQVVEAIGNVERHAQATHIKVSLKQSDGGVLGVVQDDGQGFDVSARSNMPGHLGLLALRERALMAGGRYKIESKPGAGTRIEFWIPVQG